MVEDTGLRSFAESCDVSSNAKTHVSDLDVEGAYPNATRVDNVSKDTTHRELVKIENMTKADFMLHNINIMFAKTNSLEYCQQMFKLPSFFNIVEELK